MVKVMKFDPAHFLRTREEMADFLDEAAKDDDPAMFVQSMQVVWRAMKQHGLISKDAVLDGTDNLDGHSSSSAAADTIASDDHSDRERIPA